MSSGEPFGAGYHQRKVVVVRRLGGGFLGFGGHREGPTGNAWVVSPDTAERELHLPAGHPLVDQAYVGHPLQARRYMPLAVFHQALFEQKVNEFMRLLASLGATRVRYSCTEGFRKTRSGSLGAALPVAGPEASVGGSRTTERQQEASFEEIYEVRGEAKVPDDLVWFEHEVSWRELARRRLEQGTRAFRISLTQEESYGITLDLALGLDALGLKASAGFEDFRRSHWDFEGEFAALRPVMAPAAAPVPVVVAAPAPAPVRAPFGVRAVAAPPRAAAAPAVVAGPRGCGGCGTALGPEDAYCDGCGQPAGKCSGCGRAIGWGERFCSHCGARN